jgi:hypothetical protein
MVGTPNTTITGQSANYARIVHTETFDDKGFINSQSLTEARMTNPESLNPVITHLMGEESKKFPLLFLTEGQVGGTRKIEIQDIEYDWPVIGRFRKTDSVVGHDYPVTTNGLPTKVAQGTGIFEVVFKSAWFKNQHTIISPNGIRARVEGKPTKVAMGYKYVLQLIRQSSEEFVALSELETNTVWSMHTGANVSESYSFGNESNVQTPGKVKNQIGILRKSYEIGGNVSQRTTVFKFNIGGKETNYYLPFAEFQHELNFKQDIEENLWDSKYNRDRNGVITTIDQETQLPIPMGAGIIEQIPNVDTYAKLTLKKLTSVVRDVTYGATDTQNMNIVLYTGTGGRQEFSDAIMTEASGWSLYQGALNNTISGSPMSLSFGAAFTQFRHIDGHIITVAPLSILDEGGRAASAPKHPISGLPMTSYEMHFVDMSVYDGENNVQIVTQKGRSMIRGIEQGMTLIKGMSYGDYKGNAMDIPLSTGQDKTAIHYLKTCGVAIRRNTHCFSLYCTLS